MITAGVDCGTKNVRVVVLADGRVVGRATVLAGVDSAAAVEVAYDEALDQAGLARDQVSRVTSTGAGRESAPVADDSVAEEVAAARGAFELCPEGRTVIDVGAEEGRAIKLDATGGVVEFAVNEKCAAGAGAFTESMARALGVPLEELGALSLDGTAAIAMNAQCVVFAESEMVSLLHRKVAKPDIARAVLDAIAARVTSMVRRVGLERRIILVGGMARNIGFVRELEEDLETGVVIPDDPEYAGALGAALVATDS